MIWGYFMHYHVFCDDGTPKSGGFFIVFYFIFLIKSMWLCTVKTKHLLKVSLYGKRTSLHMYYIWLFLFFYLFFFVSSSCIDDLFQMDL